MEDQLSNIIFILNEISGYLKPANFFSDISFSTITLVITLFVLIWYTIETHTLAVQSKDANLRSVILRSGYLKDWNDLDYISKHSNPLQFMILKNIATDIKGYIIINGKKHKLLFGSDITKLDSGEISYSESWGWMSPNNHVYAIFKDEGISTNLDNQIVINYKDIEGGKYYSIEDSLYKQKSFKK